MTWRALSGRPYPSDSDVVFKMRNLIGEGPFTALNLAGVFLLGWPLYLLMGASGGPVRGMTNHFMPSWGEASYISSHPIMSQRVLWVYFSLDKRN
jgi:omega-6 fatty acid desaturase (delta-12 desaturase)